MEAHATAIRAEPQTGSDRSVDLAAYQWDVEICLLGEPTLSTRLHKIGKSPFV